MQSRKLRVGIPKHWDNPGHSRKPRNSHLPACQHPDALENLLMGEQRERGAMGCLLCPGCARGFGLPSSCPRDVPGKLHPAAAPRGLAKGLIAVSPAFDPSAVTSCSVCLRRGKLCALWGAGMLPRKMMGFVMPKTLIQMLFPRFLFPGEPQGTAGDNAGRLQLCRGAQRTG